MPFRLLLIILLAGSFYSLSLSAQAPGKAISVADSARLKVFLDSVSHAPIYSEKRQRWLDSALTITPSNAYLWQQKAMPLFKKHKYEIGAPYLDSAVKYNPKRYTDYRAFMKCIFQKSYREAINGFEAARVLNGNAGVMDHPYDFYQGLCYLQLNMFDSCIWYMDKCIDYKTKANGADWVHPLHWFYNGIAWYEKENDTKAIACFDSCLARYPGFADAQYYKAVLLEKTNRHEEAVALFTEGRANFLKGKTFNEDSIFYELYPYQVIHLRYFDAYLRQEEREERK